MYCVARFEVFGHWKLLDVLAQEQARFLMFVFDIIFVNVPKEKAVGVGKAFNVVEKFLFAFV